MSSAGQIAPPADHVCYVHCNFCNTVLAVSVPGINSMLNVVTVRCGHCTNLLSVNLRGLMNSAAPAPLRYDHHLQENLSKVQGINDGGSFRDHNQSSSSQQLQQQHHYSSDHQLGSSSSSSSSSRFRMPAVMFSQQNDVLHHQQTPHARPPEKRQRVPSAYNRFIKEEIRRIKANNPDISHREAFSTAAKNWAHFPNIHFGLNPSGRECGNRIADVETTIAATVTATPAPKKIQGFCS